MTKNAKLSGQPIPEGEERYLEDGVFPFLFGDPEGPRGDPRLGEMDPAADHAAHAAGETSTIALRAGQVESLQTWYQAIGTPYGFHLFQGLQAQSRLLQSCCLRIATHFPSFEFTVPLLPWFQANARTWAEMVKAGGDHAAPLQVLVKSLRTWSSLDQALGVLAGTSPSTFRAVRNPAVLLDRWLGGSQELAIALPLGASPDDPACPTESGLAIGGNAVMKGAAKAAAFLYVLRVEEAAEAAGGSFDGGRFYKVSVFDLRTLALYDDGLVGRRPESSRQMLTFLAASDLALFTPINPTFASLREGLRWSDLHPGYRFRRIVEVIKERGLELASADPWAYWRFASAICQALKWPEVTRFLDAVRAKEKEGPEDHIGRMFRTACAEREVNPCAFVDPMEGLRTLTKLPLPAIELAGFDSSAEADNALSFAMDAELYALGFQLLFASEAPHFVCKPFAEVIEQIDSASELVRSYYGLEL